MSGRGVSVPGHFVVFCFLFLALEIFGAAAFRRASFLVVGFTKMISWEAAASMAAGWAFLFQDLCGSLASSRADGR